MRMFVDRKTSFKLPPTPIRDKLITQELRRAKALEEQKRRRAQRFDFNRQLDLYAGLSLGQSDDDEDDGDEPGDTATLDPTTFTPESIVSYSSTMDTYQPPNAISGTLKPFENGSNSSEMTTKGTNRKRKKKNKKANKYADKCMYAELLEMYEDSTWSDVDGLPENLEMGWVAVGPVPVGKRCLVATHQSSGTTGIAPNTTLRSRLLGKTLIPRFPSILPPSTVLDCILDVNWRENGILHILDVLKWKGQDICDCETTLRFWWRDTRLGELGQISLVPASYTKTRTDIYQFPYPTRLRPVPYHTDTTYHTLLKHIIPLAKTPQSFIIDVPNVPVSLSQAPRPDRTGRHSLEDKMDVEPPGSNFGMIQATHQVTVTIQSDGLLLYVAEASYENGTSPLSSWIPIVSCEDAQGEEFHQDAERLREHRQVSGPLAVFERLVQHRLQKGGLNGPSVVLGSVRIGQGVEVEMD